MKLIQKFKRALGLELDVRSFTPETHHVYYEYYALDDGTIKIRFYSHKTGECVEEIDSHAADKKQARKYAQRIIKDRMRSYVNLDN